MNCKSDFPVFKHYPDLIFLDSAASSQKPKVVIEAVQEFCEKGYANIHRGGYHLSLSATEKFEEVRNKVAKFWGTSPENCIFTKNGTEASNIFTAGFSHVFLEEGDEIVVPVSEHHANFISWMNAAKTKGAIFKVVHPNEDGIFTLADFEREITEKTKLIAFAHVSNVTGQIFPIKEIVSLAKEVGAFTIVDACQSAPHLPFHFDNLGVDGAFITGHKLGAGGTGCLLLSSRMKETFPPFLLGGDMVRDVTETDFSLLPQPAYLEPGTPAIENIIGLGTALDYLESVGGMNAVAAHEKELIAYMLEQVSEKLPHWKIVGPKDANVRSGNVSLYHPTIHHADVSVLLAEKNIAVRTGFHCANPLHHFLKIPGTVRASFWVYNEKKDVDVFVEALCEIEGMLG